MKNHSVFRVFFRTHSKAFSLVEMLMALLVASLLLAALAPVMTRKFNDNLNVSVSGGVVPNVFCAYSNDTTDTMLFDTEDTGCIVPDNTYSAGAIIASGGGGGGGAADMVKSTGTKTLITTINTGTSDLREEKTFDKYTRDMTIKITGAGGGGGGGNYSALFFPASQKDCEPFGVFISAEQNGGQPICVSKYNPGEGRDGSPNFPSSVNVVDATQNCSGGYCCWTGLTTFKGNNCNSLYSDYSGCSRSVCQYNAADAVCKNWKPLGESGPSGRLPKKEEIEAWKPWIDYNNKISGSVGPLNKFVSASNPGLRLCDAGNGTFNSSGNYVASSYATQCAGGYGRCPGGSSNETYCSPSSGTKSCCMAPVHWSEFTESGELYIIDLTGSSGSARIQKATTTNRMLVPNSTRCVIETTYKTFLGGGASSGVYAQVKVPDNVIIRATENGNGKIKTYAGAGGSGGNKESISKGTNGQRSFIEILDSNDVRIWSLRVSGGNAGAGASTTQGGEAANAVSAMCDYLDITNKDYEIEKTIECSKLPGRILSYAGEAGISGQEDANKGMGGKSYFNTTVGDYTSPGAGGSGSTCEKNDEDYTKPICSNGNNGKGGAVSVTYKTGYPGIGGGGGAAGTVLHIKSFQVRPKDLIKVKVGEGGRGGSPAANGSNGGNSYIELANSTRYEVLGGGGGYAGTVGNPDANPIIMPKPGETGVPSGLNSNTKNKLSKNDEYFPENNEKTLGTKGIESIDMQTSAGGNGGINPKISGLAEANGGTPCGGKSTSPVKINDDTEWSCNNLSNIPLPLTRTLSTTSLDKDILTNFAPGATGGGGGGWDEGSTPLSASGGASGLGGYVIIYFGEWE